MSEQEQLEFPHEAILEFLKSLNEGNEGLTVKDLKQPTPELVQKIYFHIMIDLGLDEAIINCQQAEFDLLDEIGDHPDIYKSMLAILSLQAACHNILEHISGTTTFSLSDLLNPHPKRTQRFLSVLQNFWTFCNSINNNVVDAQDKIDKLLVEKKKEECTLDDYRNKINHIRSKNVEEAEEVKVMTSEIEDLQKQSQDLWAEKQELSELNMNLKEKLEVASKTTQEIDAKVKALESDRDNLQGAVDGAAAIKKLEDDLVKIKEERECRERLRLESAEKVTAVERSTTLLTSILEVVRQYSSEKSEIKNFETKIQDIKVKLDNLVAESDELGCLIRDEDVVVKEKAQTLAKAKNQWARRRQGKQEDLERAIQELDVAKSSANEDQLRVIELGDKVRDLELQTQEESEMMMVQDTQVRSQYTRILEALEEFNRKKSANLAKLSDAKQKLDGSAGAL